MQGFGDDWVARVFSHRVNFRGAFESDHRGNPQIRMAKRTILKELMVCLLEIDVCGVYAAIYRSIF